MKRTAPHKSLGAHILCCALLLALAIAPAASGQEDLDDVLGNIGSASTVDEDAPTSEAASDHGTVAGQVFDSEAGVPVAGVSVIVIWPDSGDGSAPRQEVQLTDPDGAFKFPSIPEGSYSLSFVKSGYRASTMTGFEVVAGTLNRADFPMPPLPTEEGKEVLDLEAFVVEASTVSEIMTSLELRLESDELLNIMGAEDFSKFAAGDVAEALQRVAGVNIVDGQFAIIRGLEDRYSSTLYNGAPVPSPDPDRQSVQLDLFPSDVVSNLVVAKTFGADAPSNSSGGSIDIVTHQYPEQPLEFKFKAGTGYNGNAKDDFFSMKGSSDPNRILEGIGRDTNVAEFRASGDPLVGGASVGAEDDTYLENDFVVSLGGRKEWEDLGSAPGLGLLEDREFRFKFVAAQEADYSTAEGFQEGRQPAPPRSSPGGFVFDPATGQFVQIPGALDRSGDLSLGELNLSDGRYDLQTSEFERRTTIYGGVGFDLDRDAKHRIDGSVFFTEKEEETVQRRTNGLLPGLDYTNLANAQVTTGVFAPDLQGIPAPGSFVGTSFRDQAEDGLSTGASALANFNRSTSFERNRDLTIFQLNGSHAIDLLPGLRLRWVTNWAETTQEETSLGTDFFYEPCGFSSDLPCTSGSRIDVPETFPASIAELGEGAFTANNRLTLSTADIDEDASFTRIDLDYTLDLTERRNLRFLEGSQLRIEAGVWRERSDRDVRSGFLEEATVGTGGICSGGGTTQFFCSSESALGLGQSVFDELRFASGSIAGLRTTTNQSSRDIDAWYVRSKLTLWDRIDLLGGVRWEDILITSDNDPFVRDPATDALTPQLGAPRTFPSRYLFFDRLDNPLRRNTAFGIAQEVAALPEEGTVYNDQILGVSLPEGPCDGAPAGSELRCVDLVTQQELEQVFNGEIDERKALPSVGFAIRPIDGLSLRGAWSETVARPSFRELGYYVTVESGSDDFIVGNPQLQLSEVESLDARLEYLWGDLGDLFAVSVFKKEVQNPIESIVVRDPSNFERSSSALFRTFFNNPDTADLQGVEFEFRKNFGFFNWILPGRDQEWLEYLSLGGNYTYIDAEVERSTAELERSAGFFGARDGEENFSELEPTRRLFNQPEWIANLDLSFDHPDWGTKFTLAYFAISDVLDAAGTATVGPDGSVEDFTLDRYVDEFDELRLTVSQSLELPGSLGTLTLKGVVKNLTDSKRRIIYDPEQTGSDIPEREFETGLDYDVSVTFERTF